MSAQKKDPVPSSGKETVEKINPAIASTVDPAALAVLTGQVRNLLVFHQEMGLTAYPVAPALRQFLTRVQKPQSKPQPIPQEQAPAFGEQGKGPQGSPGPPSQQHGGQQQVRQPGNQPEQPARPHRPPDEHKGTQTTARSAAETVGTAGTVQQQLKALNQEISHCRCCAQGAPSSAHSSVAPSDAPSSVAPSSAIVGQGSPTPLLLVVGDCFIGTPSDKDLIWGKEEDAMLWRMMQAIGLDQRSVYITNMIKCPQPGPVQPKSFMEQSCFSHLEKEIQIIRPKLICAMGDSVTQALLKTKAPLVRLRGSFRPYRSPQGEVIKIMPTYHPRLLLQHPEMKQATWKDLQAVQKMLQASSHLA